MYESGKLLFLDNIEVSELVSDHAASSVALIDLNWILSSKMITYMQLKKRTYHVNMCQGCDQSSTCSATNKLSGDAYFSMHH